MCLANINIQNITAASVLRLVLPNTDTSSASHLIFCRCKQLAITDARIKINEDGINRIILFSETPEPIGPVTDVTKFEMAQAVNKKLLERLSVFHNIKE